MKTMTQSTLPRGNRELGQDQPVPPDGEPTDGSTGESRNDRASQANQSSQAGQATAEYALVMLAAAGLAGSVLAWAISTDAAGRLMNAVLDSIIGQVT